MDVLKQENDFERRKKRRDKVISRRAYSTSQTEGSAFDGIQKAKRWRLKEEIIKLFANSLKCSFPDLKDLNPVVSASRKRGHGDYNWYTYFVSACVFTLNVTYKFSITSELNDDSQNALRIWAKIRKISHLTQTYSHIRGPTDVGEVIKNNLPKSDMIMKHKWTPSVHDGGFVTIELSRKWMVEGNTFVYLLNIRAKIRRITNDSRKDINEIKTASKFILERNKGWGKSAERALEFHLLEFTDALEQACLFVLPHILCEYLYGLSKKFASYYSSMRKIGSIAETSTLLLCEATEVVMDKCFHLLGITPEISKSFAKRRVDVNAPVAVENRTSAKRKQKEAERKLERSFKDLFIACPVSVDRGPSRNSRFELFSVIPSVTTDPEFEFEEGKLFGLIAVSDKHGLLPVGGFHTSEPDVAYVSLFKVDWCDAIDIRESGILYLGNPSSQRSLPFSSSIGIWMELNVISERNDRCFEICNCKFELDTSDIWEEEIDGKCGCFSVEGEDGSTQMHYILLRDAVDTDLVMRFNTKTPRQVRGRIYAYYGSDFPYGRRPMHASYVALLFESDLPLLLEDGEIKLKRTMLAVPLNGSLIINVKLVDVDSEEVLFQDSRTFKSQPKDSSHETIEGTDCSLDLKVHWNYQA
ncbi:arginine--tRNA ligase, chloroplastic/mitochondrial [Artemisia annua]|uniref:arginine--tRNA ligase n=1 Tax=Artemisia annua TaxID=35608 RepID=A0A2U1PLA5_ARTAN|nr:arginine--tRNA ligase, chloroplastic/mitochondrial [Artemisia annua]